MAEVKIDYYSALDQISKYYGQTSDHWYNIATGTARPGTDEFNSIMNQAGVSVEYSKSGSVIGYYKNASIDVAGSTTPTVPNNSNTIPATTSYGSTEMSIPMNTTVEEGDFTEIKQSPMTNPKNVNEKFTKVTPNITGIAGGILNAYVAGAVGISMGKTITNILYQVNPDIYNGIDPNTINYKDYYGNVAGGIFNAILGTDSTSGKTQMYLDANDFAAIALQLYSKGMFASTTKTVTKPFKVGRDTYRYIGPTNNDMTFNYTSRNGNSGNGYLNILNNTSPVYVIVVNEPDPRPQFSRFDIYTYSKEPFSYYIAGGDDEDGGNTSIRTVNSGGSSVDDKIIYWDYSTLYPSNWNNYGGHFTYTGSYITKEEYYNGSLWDSSFDVPENSDVSSYIGYNLVHSSDTETTEMEGTGTQTGATVPNLSGVDQNSNTAIADAIQKIYDLLPSLKDNAVKQTVVQPDGSTKEITYVPIAIPDNIENPTSSDNSTQTDPTVDPSKISDPSTNPLLESIVALLLKQTDTPTDTGSGDTPHIIPPAGTANALFAIYNPTEAQIRSFGAWLWSPNFVDQLLKLFNDPMQAIIGLHKVFATPPISGSGTIKVGYLDSGVSSNIVGNQYTTVDCGSVNLYEYYGNVFDYNPFTKVNLYLPFIGIVPLNVGEIMRSTINIIYHVDVLTGACLAEVKINRDSAGGTLFQYSGNAAVQYPISSGSYMGIISGIMSIAGGVAGTIATGGAAMPVLLGAGASVGRMHTDIAHSGSFSGNAGAMGIKKPYLIIDRPQTALASNFQKYIGYPANYTTKLSTCSGYVKVLECHLENVNATNSELTEIESLLKEGIIV